MFLEERQIKRYIARGILLIPIIILVLYFFIMGIQRIFPLAVSFVNENQKVMYHIKKEYLNITDEIYELNQKIAANKTDFSFAVVEILSSNEKKTQIAEMKKELSSLELNEVDPETINYEYSYSVYPDPYKVSEIKQPLSNELLLIYVQQLGYLSNCILTEENLSSDYEMLDKMFDYSYDILFKRNRILESLSYPKEDLYLMEERVILSEEDQIKYFKENQKLFFDFVDEIKKFNYQVYFEFGNSEQAGSFGFVKINDDNFSFNSKEIKQYHKLRYIIRKLSSDGVIQMINLIENTSSGDFVSFRTFMSEVGSCGTFAYYLSEDQIEHAQVSLEKLCPYWYYF